MKKGFIRSTAMSLALLTSVGMFAGCGGKQASTSQPSSSGAATSAPEAAKVTYPINTTQTLSYWGILDATAAKNASDLGEIPLYKEMQAKTGVKLKFITTAANNSKEMLNLMIASSDYPDIIEYNWLNNFPGGPEKAIKDGVILPLNDLLDKNAPNFKKLVSSNKDIDKTVKTDGGKYYSFPFLRVDPSVCVFIGPMLRKDWMDELSLKSPETIDEWYTLLKTFKEKKSVDSAFTLPTSSSNVSLNIIKLTGAFIGAYGIAYDFYLQDGKVVYGPNQPAFKDFLTTMNKWYKENLIDKDLGITDRKGGDAKILGSKTGGIVGYAGSDMSKYLDSMKTKDPKFNLVGVPYPTLKKGDKPEFGHLSNSLSGEGCAAITVASKNKELAAQFLDYAYGTEGNLLMNFGIQDVSYKMENGYPKYTDIIFKNPKGLTVSEALGGYTRAAYNGPFVQDPKYMEQYYQYQQQKDAIKAWTNTNESKHLLPPVTATPEESSELATIINNVDTYREEMVMKFILGQEPLDKFDSYLAQMKKLNIDRAIELKQAALDRYNKR